MVMPLAQHPEQPNKVIVYDLDSDPAPLVELDADDIADRIFTSRQDLPNDIERIPLKAVSANKSPALAPLSALAGVDTSRIGLDTERCFRHAQALRDADILEKVRRVFSASSSRPGDIDPDLALYAGFPCEADRRLCSEIRATPPEQLGARVFAFADPRYAEMLFRYRARNFPASLSFEEAARWSELRRTRLTDGTAATTLTMEEYFREIAALRGAGTAAGGAILDALELWGHELLQG